MPDRPEQAADGLVEHLPALILERIATPHWLRAVAERLARAGTQRSAPEWVRDEIDRVETLADACRIVGFALDELGARTPLRLRFIALMRYQQRVA